MKKLILLSSLLFPSLAFAKFSTDVLTVTSSATFNSTLSTGVAIQVKSGSIVSNMPSSAGAPLILVSTVMVNNLNVQYVSSAPIGTSNYAIPVLNAANQWTGVQTIRSTNISFTNLGVAQGILFDDLDGVSFNPYITANPSANNNISFYTFKNSPAILELLANTATFSQPLISSSTFVSRGAMTVTSSSTFTDFIVARSTIMVRGGREVRFFDGDNSHFVAFKSSGVVTSTNTYTWMPSSGTAGQAIVTDGNNNLSFATISGSGGSSVYPATSTAFFPFSLEASTVSTVYLNASASATIVGPLEVRGHTPSFTGRIVWDPDFIFNTHLNLYRSVGTGTIALRGLNSDGTEVWAIGDSYPGSFGISSPDASETIRSRMSIDRAVDGNIAFYDGFAEIFTISHSSVAIKSSTPFLFRDADNSNYVGEVASPTITSNFLTVKPSVIGSIGQVPTVYNVDGSTVYLAYQTPSSGGSSIYPATSTASFPLGLTVSTVQIRGANPLQFYDLDNSHFVALKSPAVVSSTITLTLPSSTGTSVNLSLIDSGNGVLAFGAPNFGLTDGTIAMGNASGGLQNSNIIQLASFPGFTGIVNYTNNLFAIFGKFGVGFGATVSMFDDDSSNVTSFRSATNVLSDHTYLYPDSPAGLNQAWVGDGGTSTVQLINKTVIINTDTLQTGTTFYVSSGTVASAFAIPTGTNPTVSNIGQIGIDISSGQFVFHDGANVAVYSATQTVSLTIKTPAVGDRPFLIRPSADITLTSAVCISSAATSATVALEECDANGANCTNLNTATACGTTNTALALTDTSVAALNRVRFRVSALSGTADWLTVDLYYRETRK